VPEELLPLLVSPEWVHERKKRWGVTSPIYTSKVLGEFPDISDDTLIMPKWIEAAQARSIKRNGRPVLAWDIARFGEDETVGVFARSQREIEAHALEIAVTEIGRYCIIEAAHLLAALRLWAQNNYRTEQAVREILETLDTVALRDVASQLRGLEGREAKTASASATASAMAMAKLPASHLRAIASYALRAL
jgi:hypothetical protein